MCREKSSSKSKDFGNFCWCRAVTKDINNGIFEYMIVRLKNILNSQLLRSYSKSY